MSCIALVAVVKRQMAESREPGRRQARAHLKLSTAGKTGRNFFNTWLVAKSRRGKLNSKFSRSNSSNKKPRVRIREFRLFLRILILPKLTTTLEYSRGEITLVPIEFHRRAWVQPCHTARGSIRALRGCLRTSREIANLWVSQKRTSAAEAVKHRRFTARLKPCPSYRDAFSFIFFLPLPRGSSLYRMCRRS